MYIADIYINWELKQERNCIKIRTRLEEGVAEKLVESVEKEIAKRVHEVVEQGGYLFSGKES